MIQERWAAGEHGDVVSDDEHQADTMAEDAVLTNYRAQRHSYEEVIGQDLWGVSGKQTPILEKDVADTIALEAPSRSEGSTCTRTPGLTARLQPMRAGLIEEAFVLELDRLQSSKKVSYETMCHHKHPGVCSQDVHPAAQKLHAGLHKVVGAWPAGTLYVIQADYMESRDAGVNALADDIRFWHRVKAANCREGFANALVRTWGPHAKPFIAWEVATAGGWKFEMSQNLALDIVPDDRLEQPDRFLVRCIAIRYEMVRDPASNAEAARCLPEALGLNEHIAEVSRVTLFPVASTRAGDHVPEETDVVRAANKSFNELMRRGFKNCPMPRVCLDVDPHEEDCEDTIQIASLQKAMGNYVLRKRQVQRRKKLQHRGKQLVAGSRKRKRQADAEAPPGVPVLCSLVCVCVNVSCVATILLCVRWTTAWRRSGGAWPQECGRI